MMRGEAVVAVPWMGSFAAIESALPLLVHHTAAAVGCSSCLISASSRSIVVVDVLMLEAIMVGVMRARRSTAPRSRHILLRLRLIMEWFSLLGRR